MRGYVPITDKKLRTLEIFFRGIRGEELSPSRLAAEYGLSVKSITRSINEIKSFLAADSELAGDTALVYSYASRAYRLFFDGYLAERELYALAKALIVTRAFSAGDVERITGKLKRLTAFGDRERAERILDRELSGYRDTGDSGGNVLDNLWRLVNAIADKREISVVFYKDSCVKSQKRVRPVALNFTEFCFFLAAYNAGRGGDLLNIRVDRITKITEHRKRFDS